jgi:hypothetical protein
MADCDFTLHEERQDRMLDRIDEILRIIGAQEGLRCRGDVLFAAVEEKWRQVLMSRPADLDRQCLWRRNLEFRKYERLEDIFSLVVLILVISASYLMKPVSQTAAHGPRGATGKSRACPITGASPASRHRDRDLHAHHPRQGQSPKRRTPP